MNSNITYYFLFIGGHCRPLPLESSVRYSLPHLKYYWRSILIYYSLGAQCRR